MLNTTKEVISAFEEAQKKTKEALCEYLNTLPVEDLEILSDAGYCFTVEDGKITDCEKATEFEEKESLKEA